MSRLKLTQHAQIRMQQRAVTTMQVELIHQFGEQHYQKGGTYVTFISDRKLAALRAAVDSLYKQTLVLNESDVLITVMHQEPNRAKRMTTCLINLLNKWQP